MVNHESESLFIPIEYKDKAKSLFPDRTALQGADPAFHVFLEFAELLGINMEYKRILGLNDDDLDFVKFIASFYKNLELLIDKTWVEKSDEMRKEMLHARLPAFFAELENRHYERALDEFGTVLGELAFLLFGDQCRKKDFIEYTFRIDSQMGLFWWYAAAFRKLKFQWKQENIRALLLIGLCYLSNF